MPEYSSTTITPADGVKTPAMNGSTSGNYTLSALRDFILASKGQANGLASLDANGKLPSSQLPDLADDVIVVASYASLPATGTAGKIYITADNNKMYRWDPDLATPDYVELSIDLSEYARIVDIQDGNIQAGVAVKAFQDAMGRAIITTYETKADASDLKSAIQGNTARIENLEQEHGGYVTVNYRGTNAVPPNKAKYALAESIVGKSRAWNQMMQYPDGYPNANIYAGMFCHAPALEKVNIISGHKYLFIFVQPAGCALYRQNTTNLTLDSGGTWSAPTVATQRALIATAGASAEETVNSIVSKNETTETAYALSGMMIRDLSVIFPDLPSTDLVTSNIPNLVKLCPDLLKYDAYGTSIVDTTVEGVKSVGVNIWDEHWKMGHIVSGVEVSDGTYRLISSDYSECKPNTEYFYYCSMSSGCTVYVYDKDKNYLGYDFDSQDRNISFTTRADAWYFKIQMYAVYGSSASDVYKNDVQICDNSLPIAVKQIHHAYMTDTLPLPTSVTLRSAGTVAEVYDLETGEKTNPIGSYTFTGNEAWSEGGTNTTGIVRMAFTALQGIIKGVDNDVVANITNGAGYSAVTNNQTYTKVKGISVASNGNIYIYDENYNTSGSSTSFASYMAGKTIYFELATPDDPTQLTPVINNTIQTEGGGTINTIQTQTPVIDNCLDVGYLAL